MENLSKRFAGAVADGPPRFVPQLPDVNVESPLAQAAYVDLKLMGMPRVNLLLAGPDNAVHAVLDLLSKDLREPVTRWRTGEPLVLPRVERGGTMVLEDIGSLPRADQLNLLDWIEAASGRTQIVSTTRGSLMSRVRSGQFLDMLYYRLNTLYVDLANP